MSVMPPTYGPPPQQSQSPQQAPPMSYHPWPYAAGQPPRRQHPLLIWLVVVLTVVGIGTTAGVGAATSGDGGSVQGDPVQGNGYSYVMPEGWSELTGTEGTDGLDTVSGTGTSMIDGTEGVAVGLTSLTATDLEDELISRGEAALSELPDASNVERIEDTTVDGEPAIGWRASYHSPETHSPYQITAYVVAHDGQAYAISYSSKGDMSGHHVEEFADILATWEWEKA